jgi:glutathione S-transferase
VCLRLQYVVGSPNCRKVHAVIDHLGVDVELDYLDFFSGDLRGASYAALNPNAMVPTLIDGDFTLWESNAINLYLASRQPTPLYPSDPRTRADIVRWLCWELAHYNRALGALSFEAVAKPSLLNMPTDAAAVALARRDLERFAPVLERHLRDREHMVGDGTTLADYAVGHLQGFKDLVPFDWSRFPAINAFYERLAANPHWAATAPRDPAAIGRRPSRAPGA